MYKRKAYDEINPKSKKIKMKNIKTLIDFTKYDNFTDIIIECGTIKFNFSKFILARDSVVFKNLLTDCGENIIIVNDDVDNFNILLNVLYGNGMICINENNYYDIYMLLDKYDINNCRDYIENLCITHYKLSDRSINMIINFRQKDIDKMCNRYVFCRSNSFGFNGFNKKIQKSSNKELIDNPENVLDEFWLKCSEISNYNVIDVEFYDTILKYVKSKDFERKIIDVINNKQIIGKNPFSYNINN
jgi:hypothetical protein